MIKGLISEECNSILYHVPCSTHTNTRARTHAHRQAGRQAEKWTDRQTHTHTHTLPMVPSLHMEAVQQVVVAVTCDVHPTSTTLNHSLNLKRREMNTGRHVSTTDCCADTTPATWARLAYWSVWTSGSKVTSFSTRYRTSSSIPEYWKLQISLSFRCSVRTTTKRRRQSFLL